MIPRNKQRARYIAVAALVHGNEPRYIPSDEGRPMYTADRECSPAWESIAYERADARNRLEKTRGQLFGLRAHIFGSLSDTWTPMSQYTAAEREAVLRATLNRALDWIDMLMGPTYLDVTHSEPKGGETHE